ncbi:hypothetical protein Pcinc_013029 [Petrolisthes cinctipes]|uniref:Secreted protein n=1 Tax=Petrolisthes cinctipes TaxID=88211 RepID=A0AAE1FXM5_PETCI|nr:hypothetical protein Pcinc_013029 [Petrolisthes cinctipes]
MVFAFIVFLSPLSMASSSCLTSCLLRIYLSPPHPTLSSNLLFYSLPLSSPPLPFSASYPLLCFPLSSLFPTFLLPTHLSISPHRHTPPLQLTSSPPSPAHLCLIPLRDRF